MKTLKSLFIIFLFTASLASAQVPWNGILTTSRATDWRNVGATIPAGSIPDCGTQPTASIASINSAWTADAGGGSYCVMHIPSISGASGTVLLQYAGKANVILRGTGANASILTWTTHPSYTCGIASATFFCIYNGDSGSPDSWSNRVSWTGGLAQGSTVLTFASTTNLQVGGQVVLYQTDLASDPGNIFPCQTSGFPGACSWQGTGATPVSSGSPGVGASQFQIVTVSACNGVSTYGASCGAGTSVTITPGVYLPNWNSGQSPHATWSGVLPVSNVGIEDLEINNQSGANGVLYELTHPHNVWLNGVASLVDPSVASDTNHVLTWDGDHVTIENSYFYGSYPGSSGYGVDPAISSCDVLIQNNITQHMDTGFMSESGCGDVYGYNYAIDNYFGDGWQQSDQDMHAAGDYYDLKEGNEGINYNGDSVHGSHWFITQYRNYYSGFDPTTYTGGKNENISAINHAAYDRYDNDVANVLGTPSKFSTYKSIPSSTTSCSPGPNFSSSSAVIVLGYSDSYSAFSAACQGSAFTIYNDSVVAASTVLFANYDTVNGSVQENSAEYASSAPVYPGLASPSTSFPPSFYLPSGTPSWWTFPGGSASPFPSVGPDVTGGNISGLGGHAWHNAAWYCYNVINSGVTNGNPTPISFNRASCYTGSSSGYSLTVSTAGSGTGSVSGTNCSSATLASGTSVGACTATPSGLSTFTGWSTTGSASCSGTGTCGPFNITANTTITANFSTTPTCADPAQLSPNFSGTYMSPPTTLPLTIGFTEATAGCSMFMTLDGSTPTCSSTAYANQSISSTTQMRVIACQTSYTSSNVIGGLWTIDTSGGTLAAPTASPNGSVDVNTAPYFLPAQFTLAVTPTFPSGSTLCYSTSGTPPAASTPGTCSSGATYTSGTISITANQQLQMLATETGFTNSPITSVYYNQRNIVLHTQSVFNGGPSSYTSVSCPSLTPSTGDGIVIKAAFAPALTATITDNVNAGNYPIAIPAHFNTCVGGDVAMWYRSAIAGSPTVVTMNLSGAGSYIGLVCAAYTPSSAGAFALDSGFIQQQDFTSSTSPTTGSAIAPTYANELIVGNLLTNRQIPLAGTSYTLLDNAPGPDVFPEYWVQGAAVATNAPYTLPVADCGADEQAAFRFTPTAVLPPIITGHVTFTGTVGVQ